jgi:hypothetical protein
MNQILRSLPSTLSRRDLRPTVGARTDDGDATYIVYGASAATIVRSSTSSTVTFDETKRGPHGFMHIMLAHNASWVATAYSRDRIYCDSASVTVSQW